MQVTAAYLRAGAMLRSGAFQSARRVLMELADELDRLAPEGAYTPQHAAVLGAIQLKLGVLEARDGDLAASEARLRDADAAAGFLRGQDTTHYELSFGPSNVRIHRVAALIDAGDTEQALARLREWGAEDGLEEWAPPFELAAERRSHHHIDVASARLAEGDRVGALRDLRTARQASPAHTRFHPTTRSTAGALARLDRHAQDSVTSFAQWAGI